MEPDAVKKPTMKTGKLSWTDSEIFLVLNLCEPDETGMPTQALIKASNINGITGVSTPGLEKEGCLVYVTNSDEPFAVEHTIPEIIVIMMSDDHWLQLGDFEKDE
jgi:hypothetical protein